MTGFTDSHDFPGINGGADSTISLGEAFVSQLSSDLKTIIQSSYLGGSGGQEFGRSIAIHPFTGDIYVAGGTTSKDFPKTSGGADELCSQCSDSLPYNFEAFVSRFNNLSAQQQYYLTVTTTGEGTVTSDPAGIDCGALCSKSYVSGTPVTLTPTPALGYVFAGWGGACSGTGNCQVTMVTNESISATFAPGQKPNLTPYKPSSWSNKILVSNKKGTRTDTKPFYTTDKLYLDWAIINNGKAEATGTFACDLYIDDDKQGSLYLSGPLDSKKFVSIADYPIGSLSAGTHTIKIVVDPAGMVDESNESDNEYTRTITVAIPSITLASPNGGEAWKVGTSNTIAWTYKGKPGATVKIQLLKGGVVNKTLSSNAPVGNNGSGSFTWSIPANQARGNNYKVSVKSNAIKDCQDTSSSSFSITAP